MFPITGYIFFFLSFKLADEKLESRAVALKAGEDLIRLEELEAKRRDEEEEKNENKARKYADLKVLF